MKRQLVKKALGIFLALTFLVLNYSSYVQNIKTFPSELKLFEGDSKIINFHLPFQVKIESDDVNVLKLNGNSLKDQQVYSMDQPLSLQSVEQGDASLYLKLFGFIPIKQIKVKVEPPKKLYPGGHSIGVSLYTRGALVVGTAEVVDDKGVVHYPAMDAGIIPGDVIERVNGIPIKNAAHLAELVNKQKEKGLDLEVRRGQFLFETHIVPAQDKHDSKYRLGMWVRDSTAGVGTLTFYDPDTGSFGALGHAITDVDTGSLLPVKDGEIMESRIIDVKQGKKGSPGELKGVFTEKQNVIGSILKNTQHGIYGKMHKNIPDFYFSEPIPICYQHDIKPGPALILSTVDEEGIKAFSIEILKVNRQSEPNSKGMIIQITDPELLKRTGGIVQGMSGSPIIQDGKLVGAVTHVFVNDPRKGYGIFIEWMLEEADKMID